MTQHTPGPWTLVDESRMGPKHDLAIYFDVFDAGENRIAGLEMGEYDAEFAKDDIACANSDARLIAAAPELYEELQPIAAVLLAGQAVMIHPDDDRAQRILSAIAKAQGETVEA